MLFPFKGKEESIKGRRMIKTCILCKASFFRGIFYNTTGKFIMTSSQSNYLCGSCCSFAFLRMAISSVLTMGLDNSASISTFWHISFDVEITSEVSAMTKMECFFFRSSFVISTLSMYAMQKSIRMQSKSLYSKISSACFLSDTASTLHP